MGAADIVGFAICWIFAAAVLTWGVLSERRRGGSHRSLRRRPGGYDSLAPVPRRRRSDQRSRRWPAPGRGRVIVLPPMPEEARSPARPAESDWIVVESLPGSGPGVRAEGELLVTAALAARGLEPGDLGPGDRRTEVTYPADGQEVTLFLLRAGVLTPAEPS
ncbi:MAG: hypothetical protein ACYDEN_05145 [Acidimicrobiales bacterium]